VLLDPLPPMSLTSAASGENYRNWWPHPTMTAFTDYSIDLMEAIARDSGNRLHMMRRGYALASRRTSLDAALRQLRAGYGQDGAARIRVHRKGAAARYLAAAAAGWEDAPDGVDVVDDPDLIRRAFPSFDPEVSLVLHVRRAGDIAGQQMGQHMMEQIRAAGGRIVPARVIAAGGGDRFDLEIEGRDGAKRLSAEILVDAAGPYLAEVAAMLGEDLPVATVAQQKIAFEDSAGAIPRDMPFAIDLDGQTLDWSEEERALLREEPATSRFAEAMPGGVHCRPDGGAGGRWVKLGWAFNRSPGRVEPTPPLDPHFPEIVLRGASRLNPGLKAYYGRLPRQVSHYGGYYTMTRENWPLIGPLRTPGAFVAGALSGFGTMGACAAGACCASWICGGALPGFARNLSLARYGDGALMAELAALESTGVL
jgi:glycine/D-amino acid oxidase-like deaminating enzyme